MSLQDLVVVTGMSGSGKGTVLKAFEDMGFFCIDNLPVSLIPKFIEGIHVAGGEVERAALVIDIRAGEKLRDLEKLLVELKKYEFRLFVLCLEARDDVLVRRFSETRRPHPLTGAKSLRSFPETKNFVERVRDFLQYLVPYYVREGKTYLTVAIGCTGGRHRSVFTVEELARVLKLRKVTIRVRHRDTERT